MIIALLSDIERASSSACQRASVDGGRCLFGLGLVDQLDFILGLLVVGRGRHDLEVRIGVTAAGGPDRALHAGDEVAEHFLADQETAFQLADRSGRWPRRG